VLTVEGLSAGYDDSVVVQDVSLHVDDGEAVAVIGSNGAGKTTLLRTICGLLPARSGTVAYGDHALLGKPAHSVARLGVAYVPAERHLFSRMSVQENLELGAYPARPDQQQLERVFELFPRLKDRRRQQAGTMSGGEQQMLAVGRALMARPSLLVLDEPTTGLAPILAEEAYASLKVLRSEGTTVLVAEQQVPLALDLADRAYVIEDGRIQMDGLAADLVDHPDVRRAYLGIA
jgi:branched-chain amino acid transport system ATP-binding protein